MLATAVTPIPRSMIARRMTVESPAMPPPGLSQTSAITRGPFPDFRSSLSRASAGVNSSILVLPRIAYSSSPKLAGQCAAFFPGIVCNDNNLCTHFRHVAGEKPVHDGNRQNMVVTSF